MPLSLYESSITAFLRGFANLAAILERGRAFAARDYVQNFALPNFYFHPTMAYALLRMKGVPLGKLDYLGAAR